MEKYPSTALELCLFANKLRAGRILVKEDGIRLPLFVGIYLNIKTRLIDILCLSTSNYLADSIAQTAGPSARQPGATCVRQGQLWANQSQDTGAARFIVTQHLMIHVVRLGNRVSSVTMHVTMHHAPERVRILPHYDMASALSGT